MKNLKDDYKLLEEEKILRELSRRKLKNFVLYNFDDFRLNWHHEVIFNKLEAIERGEIKRIMFFLPPRHSKSEIGSIQFPAWVIGRDKDRHIIEASYSADLATDFGRQTRNLIRSQKFQNIFSNVSLAPDSEAKGKWNTNGRGAYNAVGVGGATTGKGADFLIIDDPIKNRQDAESSVVRENIWNWYRSTARTRLSPTGAIILIMTRWHDDDLAGRILNQKYDSKWEVVKFAAIAEEDDKFRKKEEALWADFFTKEVLKETREDIGPYEWSALYQQEPIASENQEFHKHWFRERISEEIEKLQTRKYLTIDTAISASSSADSTGFCDNTVDVENIWNLRAWKLRVNPKELIDALFTLHEKRSYDKIGIEKTIYLQTLKPFLDDEMRKRGKFLPIVELYHRQISKELRIRGLIPRYSSGSIYHIKGECKDLEYELLRFPKGVTDDVIDATAYQLQIAEKPFNIKMHFRFNDQQKWVNPAR